MGGSRELMDLEISLLLDMGRRYGMWVERNRGNACGIRRKGTQKMEKSTAALTALTSEARRRGISYGRLVMSTTEQEREEIVERYQNRGGEARMCSDTRDP